MTDELKPVYCQEVVVELVASIVASIIDPIDEDSDRHSPRAQPLSGSSRDDLQVAGHLASLLTH